MPTKTTTPAPRRHRFGNLAQVAVELGVSMRQARELRHQAWFPPALVLGPRTLRYDLDLVAEAMARHAPRARVGVEPAQLSASRSRSAA